MKIVPSSTKVCLLCKEPLEFIPGKGWVHQSDKKQKNKLPDHPAFPVDFRNFWTILH